MAGKYATTGLSAKGLAISLSMHLFWFFLFVPVVKSQASAYHAGSSFFLGSILQGDDLRYFPAGLARNDKRFFLTQDLGRGDYFKKADGVFSKPKVYGSAAIKYDRQARPQAKLTSISGDAGRDIVFGISDFSDHLDNVDFAELKRISTREDVSGFIEVQVLLGAGGTVKNIKKVTGSGDPILDLYCIRKFRTAVFKDFLHQGKLVNVRFKIKD
ncbi:MAG TPA: hypothetical protein DCL35_03695 [Candidatus Omnitrophica bacterium]|nr:hypothetical protein [Candidatus Omnitrophota bacterium]